MDKLYGEGCIIKRKIGTIISVVMKTESCIGAACKVTFEYNFELITTEDRRY